MAQAATDKPSASAAKDRPCCMQFFDQYNDARPRYSIPATNLSLKDQSGVNQDQSEDERSSQFEACRLAPKHFQVVGVMSRNPAVALTEIVSRLGEGAQHVKMR